MDVYLRNVPLHCSKKILHDGLATYLHELNITDWACDKMVQQRCGRILFAHLEDAEKFLRAYTAQSPKKSKLLILGTGILAEKGKLKVSKTDIAHVKHVAKQRKIYVSEMRANKVQPQHPIVRPLLEVCCGKNQAIAGTNIIGFVAEASTTQSAEVKFSRMAMFINFSNKAQIEILYDSIWEATTGDKNEILFILQYPPRFFVSISLEDQVAASMASGTRRGPSYTKTRVSYLNNLPNHMLISGTCLVYKIRIDGTYQAFQSLDRELSSRRLFPLYSYHPFSTLQPTRTLSYRYNHAEFKRWISQETVHNLDFSTCFQLQLAVWNNFLPPNIALQLGQLISEKTHKMPHDKTPLFSSEAMKRVITDIPYPSLTTEVNVLSPQSIFSRLQKAEKDLRIRSSMGNLMENNKAQEKLVLVHKAWVTPARITLIGPEYESKNRVLRKFHNYLDYFLRVQFCDEDGDDVRFSGRISNEQLMQRFLDIFEHGIQIGGRVFSFLGFSHSSLRSHSAWFTAPFFHRESNTLQTHIDIIRNLGNFSDIRTPARCAARIGQAFSETPFSVSLGENDIKYCYIPDLKSPDGKRVFSDGVGSISYDAVEVIWNNIPNNESFPTCFQVRWGGAKGMLALDARLSGKVICVRKESMVKFESTDIHELEICDMASRPLRLVLNRQIIKILEDMGVPNEWFIDIQAGEIEALRTVTSDPYNTSSFLQDQLIGRRIQLSSFIRKLHNLGINYLQDIFMRRVVEMAVLRELRLLKNKARIPIRKGVTLFGIVDETGFLEPHEVYVAIDKPYLDMFDDYPAAGRLLVTRSPALHPGDIQGAVQKTPPEGHPLRELTNCIVFSQRGNRDLPSQLSGGDLDGDIYNVIWDPAVVNNNDIKLFEPADYPRVTPKTLDRKVEREDIAKFFVDFMRTDQLGVIANRHQILADQKPAGTLDFECLKLAEMHSNAVDFSKTGLAVDVNEMPRAPRYRPDFMAPSPPAHVYKHGEIKIQQDIVNPDADPFGEEDEIAPAHRYYESERILGILYRNVDERNIWDATKMVNVKSDDTTVWSQIQAYVDGVIRSTVGQREIDWMSKKREAAELRSHYQFSMQDIMQECAPNYMNPLSEVEVFCGFIFSREGSQSRRQREASIKIGGRVDELTAFIAQRMRCRDRPPTDIKRKYEALEMCLACFKLQNSSIRPSAEERLFGGAQERGDEVLKGFRVIAGSCLLRELAAVVLALQRAHKEEVMAAEANKYLAPGVASYMDSIAERFDKMRV
ncbi:hypothetical protein TD95_001628 [Thielaviopsis punctulata]|uniref:RNA-dependent RNA polymerase n=1 Tax=Thielaviopsis punctulata TaxID=72032 RepID=A0A0F4Z987_9PEZI|nr:hypothetical protein TD95_001628 [Thielaviopsis punctulata]